MCSCGVRGRGRGGRQGSMRVFLEERELFLRERLAGEAMLLSRGESAARFGAFVAEETRRWAPVLRGLGLG